MASIIDALNWRYATKQYDVQKKLTAEQFKIVTEALRLSASSLGLQPWKFIIVSDPVVRAKLRGFAWDQPQLTDASHMIVLAVKKNLDDATVDAFIKNVADTRSVPTETLKEYGDAIKGSISGRSPEGRTEWASRQVYIALGTALTAAASHGIDATPMEGFDPKKFDEVLGLDALGLESRVLLALGFRSAADKTAEYKKVRFSNEEVFITV